MRTEGFYFKSRKRGGGMEEETFSTGSPSRNPESRQEGG